MSTDALTRLAAAEERFLASEFLAPVIRGGQVQVRIAGVICALRVQPADFEGWGVFRPASHTEATLVRQAKLAERQRYLDLFPLRPAHSGRTGARNNGWPCRRIGPIRVSRSKGSIPVRLVEDAQLFEVIETRFDGSQFWYRRPRSALGPGDGELPAPGARPADAAGTAASLRA